MMYKYVKWSEKKIISKQTNFFLLFHFTFLRVLDNTCSTLRKYLYNFFFFGGGYTGCTNNNNYNRCKQL